MTHDFPQQRVTEADESAGAVLRNRRFLSLWIAQIVTQVGRQHGSLRPDRGGLRA